MAASKPIPQKTIGLWTRPDVPKIITEENIFDYMDGAGELYLGYRFDHCESYEYGAKEQREILVELYVMKTPDDAFGLLSLDWGGDPIDLTEASGNEAPPSSNPYPSALYGQGLLRLCVGALYIRIMAAQETPESREAVLTIGRALTEGRKDMRPPELLKAVPDTLSPDWKLRRDRTAYFRSHLVLNSLYYLGHENMLDLDLDSEAVTSEYETTDSSGKKARIRFLVVRYPDNGRAVKAAAHFQRAYLPDHPGPQDLGSSGDAAHIFSIEDGWLAYTVRDEHLAFVFECPDREAAGAIIDQIEAFYPKGGTE
ncbi:MAG: hypothetical protein JXB23_13915 [Candidatus Aminicenantes bacterium]|nr:hypothetical protein [Candidatus Aminicenantes bacterium]